MQQVSSVEAAEAEYLKSRELLETIRQMERAAVEIHRSRIHQLGRAWREAAEQ